MLTFDLDFGDTFAVARAEAPSVIIFRLRNQTPAAVNHAGHFAVIAGCESERRWQVRSSWSTTPRDIASADYRFDAEASALAPRLAGCGNRNFVALFSVTYRVATARERSGAPFPAGFVRMALEHIAWPPDDLPWSGDAIAASRIRLSLHTGNICLCDAKFGSSPLLEAHPTISTSCPRATRKRMSRSTE